MILISENTDQLLDFFRLLQQLPAAQLSAEHILSLFFEFLLKKHKEEHDQLEDLIEELDNDVLNDNLQNFNQRITGIRNRIRYLLQYEQFSDVCESCWRMKNDLFAKRAAGTIFASVPIGWNDGTAYPHPARLQCAGS